MRTKNYIAENIDNKTSTVVNYKNQNFMDYRNINLGCILYNIRRKQ